jgi:hypothetical protein
MFISLILATDKGINFILWNLINNTIKNIDSMNILEDHKIKDIL